MVRESCPIPALRHGVTVEVAVEFTVQQTVHYPIGMHHEEMRLGDGGDSVGLFQKCSVSGHFIPVLANKAEAEEILDGHFRVNYP